MLKGHTRILKLDFRVCLLFVGIDITLKVVCHCSRSSPFYHLAAKLIKIFVGNAAIPGDKRNVPSSISTSPRKRDERGPLSTLKRYVILCKYI